MARYDHDFAPPFERGYGREYRRPFFGGRGRGRGRRREGWGAGERGPGFGYGYRGPSEGRFGYRGPSEDRFGYRGPSEGRFGYRGPSEGRFGYRGPSSESHRSRSRWTGLYDDDFRTVGLGYGEEYKSRWETERGDPFGDRERHTPIRMMRGGWGDYGHDYGRPFRERGYGLEYRSRRWR